MNEKKKCKKHEREISREEALDHLFYFCGRQVKAFFHVTGVDSEFSGILLYETKGEFTISRGEGTPAMLKFSVDVVTDLNGQYITIDMR